MIEQLVHRPQMVGDVSSRREHGRPCPPAFLGENDFLTISNKLLFS